MHDGQPVHVLQLPLFNIGQKNFTPLHQPDSGDHCSFLLHMRAACLLTPLIRPALFQNITHDGMDPA
jgi:hypothetical protein